MRPNTLKAALIKAGLAASSLLLASHAFAQTAPQQVTLTAAPTTLTAPDGSVLPMWGYFCGTAAAGSTASCSALNPASVSTVTTVPSTWSPVVITIPYTTGTVNGVVGASTTTLQINLANHLQFAQGTSTTAFNSIPTSLVILGQLGGGLGTVGTGCTAGATCDPATSFPHGSQVVTWSTVGAAPAFTPPGQGPRVRSMGAEVAATASTATTTSPLCWGNCTATQPGLLPGTYLIQSGTHASVQVPMGLYGILIVTTPATATVAGTAYPSYTLPIINGAAAVTVPAVTYAAEARLAFGEIDPIQNMAVNAAVRTAGFTETRVWSGQPGMCGNSVNLNGTQNTTTFNTCYPPTVNYTPLYYTVNGVAFDRTHATTSLFPAYAGIDGTAVSTGLPATGNLLVRMVNAGSRMHVPSIVGATTTQLVLANATGTAGSATANTASVPGFSIIAEDGNRLPGVPHVQSDVFMAAGKTFDVMINAPPAGSTAVPVYDRELSLSGNSSERDAGMLAYIGYNGSAEPAATSIVAAAGVTANPDTYNSLIPCTVAPCTPLVVSDTSKGVIANDVNVYGVTLLAAPAATAGTVVLNHNGTFAFTPAANSTGATFTYCANGSVTGTVCSSGKSATVTIGLIPAEAANSVTVANATFTATTGTYINIRNPGLLQGATDVAGLPVSLNTAFVSTVSTGLTLVATDASGGFTATNSGGTSAVTCPTTAPIGAACYTFTFQGKSARGTLSNTATATLVFPKGSGLNVKVLDGYDHTTTISDYRWIIEEDQTFYVDPNKTTNTGGTSLTCTAGLGTAGCIVPTFGVNFHTSHMGYVAQGCTGALSCEAGQTMVDTRPGSTTFGQSIAAVCDLGDGTCRPDPNAATSPGITRLLPSQVALDPSKRYFISVLPGDSANPFIAGYTGIPCGQPGADPTTCKIGHGMGGTPIPAMVCGPPASGTGTLCTFPTTGATCTPATGQTICLPANGTANPTAFAVTALTQPAPYPPSKLSVFVFEDDFPLNGEHDASGIATTATGNDTLAPNEPGLGGFQVHLWDAMGQAGDFTGQMTYDMFNMPLTNSLDGTIDPSTNQDACPITQIGVNNPNTNATSGPVGGGGVSATGGITGMIVTCPKYEADGTTLSPLAGQAVISNLMPMRMGVIATPGADRIARGEEWLQTNTLDGQKAHDAFARIGEPSYFQEFGPASFHVSIGFANPAIINARLGAVCAGTDPFSPNYPAPYSCNNTLTGKVTGQRLSRTPDERLYSSGSHDAYSWTQCYVSFGDADGEDFSFAKCNADGTFVMTGLPDGDWRVTTFDQWNDQLVDGLSTPARLGSTLTADKCPGPISTVAGSAGAGNVCDMGDIGTTQWETNLQTKIFFDDNKDGVYQGTEGAAALVNIAVRLRDGSLENLNTTDFTGVANYNETFPLFSWYVVEPDTTRYKNTGTHVVYDAGGPADGTLSTCGGSVAGAGYPACGNSAIAKNLANSAEQVSLPNNLRIPGSVYCGNGDCTGYSVDPAGSTAAGTAGTHGNDTTCSYTAGSATTTPTVTCTGAGASAGLISTGRIDNPWYGAVEGWQGFPGQFSFMEFGKEPYSTGENGGIKGHVVYASTRPFDDPMMLVQTQWEPLVPRVRINLYQEGFEADGVTPTLKLVDWTTTTSFDDWAQGFNSLNAPGYAGIPNMNCPGQTGADLFFFTLYNQPQYLDWYNNVQHGTAPAPTQLPYNSQFKCYDGMHNWNQVQPAPYDGQYKFPSVNGVDATGKPLPVTAGVAATNCTICTADSTTPASDLYYGIPQLPIGKYVVEVVVPPGFELVKEEDKNILIGDNYIAPAVQEFAGTGAVFIVPDQASVANSINNPSGAAYNANSGSVNGAGGNGFNFTQSLGTTPMNGIVPGFVPEPLWPCVGEKRVVPNYISLYPQSKQMAPFAGATRSLCDRKEVTLSDQMGAIAKFYVYTSTHTASKFTGVITDDYTSEFDPFSPQFGEKFSPPNLPVSVKDWSGQEINRVWADQWGEYDGMTYSTWEVNPPNPTGYAPSMMVMCMNDPGPILDTRQQVLLSTGLMGANPTLGQTVTDPLFTSGYSQFCYELPFMPGTTSYLDTPVVPTSAFAGAGYNNVDCAYPTLTPAIKEVDSQDGVGPWVSAAGRTITITALGDTTVPNYAYNGPGAITSPYNQKQLVRHYGFGATAGTVTIGGVPATTGLLWGDAAITVQVPAGVPNCAIQQQATYGGSTAQCGQLVITTAATATSPAMQSTDTVTVTIGGSHPKHILASGTIQTGIDTANPGDLLIVDPTCILTTTATGVALPAPCATTPTAGQTLTKTTAAHNEMVIMWKPVRLQGAGAIVSIINANTHPAGETKVTAWRRQIDCLFGISLDGYPIGSGHAYDQTGSASCPGTGWVAFNGNGPIAGSAELDPQVDRIPLEAILGWDASQNGNLAELLQEPSLMGALEGAGITVLAKGVQFPNGAVNVFGGGAATAGAMPTGTLILTAADCVSGAHPSDFLCNPSSIDAMGITNSSQGGGGIFIHGWNHYLQVANNRIYNNAGTLSGGINVGQGEFNPGYVAGSALNAAPGSCDVNTLGSAALFPVTVAAGQQEPYCTNLYTNIHNNAILLDSSTGDELYSATPAGAGGVTITTGSDNYKFQNNFVCGNLSSGDGGGMGHVGYTWNGDIEHNTVVFNQSTNPTIPANGGGLLIAGAPDADPPCGATTDADCVPNPTTVGPSDGVGPNLLINANLIMGNAAESGSGGGIAFQHVNGGDVVTNPNAPTLWHHVVVQNNIIANNVCGWDGCGASFLDALNLDFVNNTVVGNNSTASAGPLVNTIGAPLASTQNNGNNCFNGIPGSCGTASLPQPAGLVTQQNSVVLVANMGLSTTPVVCPAGHYQGATASNGTCRNYSYPKLANNILWQNASFQVGVGSLSATYQQNIIALYNAAFAAGNTTVGSAISSQTSTGQCFANSSYWDLGVRGDTGPTNHNVLYPAIGGTAVVLNPTYSILTSTTGYTGPGNSGTAPGFTRQICDGARQPPESCPNGLRACGWDVPAGISDATVPNPVFNLSPAVTVDEGNNWINLRWGPLSMVAPVAIAANGGQSAVAAGSLMANYAPVAANNLVPAAQSHPATDFFGNLRPEPGESSLLGTIDAGAVEVGSVAGRYGATLAPNPLAFGVHTVGTSTTASVTLTDTGTIDLTTIAVSAPTAPFTRSTATGQCGGTLTANAGGTATCTISFVYAPTAAVSSSGTVTITASQAGTPVSFTLTLTGTGAARISNVTLTPNPWTVSAPRGCATTGTVGLCPTQIFTLTNAATSNVNAVVGSIGTVTGSTDFSRIALGSNCVFGLTLTPGNSCTVVVRFAPPIADTLGAKAGVLTVAYTPAGGVATTATATLAGTTTGGTAAFSAPTPTLVTGTTTAHSGTITVTNTATGATAGPITLTALPTAARTAGGVGTGAMARTGGTCAIGTVITVAGGLTPSCTIIVTYTPGTTGTTSTTGTVTFTGIGTNPATTTSATFGAN